MAFLSGSVTAYVCRYFVDLNLDGFVSCLMCSDLFFVSFILIHSTLFLQVLVLPLRCLVLILIVSVHYALVYCTCAYLMLCTYSGIESCCVSIQQYKHDGVRFCEN